MLNESQKVTFRNNFMENVRIRFRRLNRRLVLCYSYITAESRTRSLRDPGIFNIEFYRHPHSRYGTKRTSPDPDGLYYLLRTYSSPQLVHKSYVIVRVSSSRRPANQINHLHNEITSPTHTIVNIRPKIVRRLCARGCDGYVLNV